MAWSTDESQSLSPAVHGACGVGGSLIRLLELALRPNSEVRQVAQRREAEGIDRPKPASTIASLRQLSLPSSDLRSSSVHGAWSVDDGYEQRFVLGKGIVLAG